MLADLDLLLIAVFCTADDLLPESVRNARRSVTDAEVVTLAVAQEMLGIDHDAEFLALAHRLLAHLFPKLPQQPGYWKRRQRLSDTIEWLIGTFAADSPGYRDQVVLLDSTPGRVRPLGRNRPPLPARRRLRLRLFPQPFPLVLGNAPAPVGRARRHATRRDPRPRRSEGT
jgi:hypothetical protein